MNSTVTTMSDQTAPTSLQHRREEILAKVRDALLEASAKTFHDFLKTVDEGLLARSGASGVDTERFDFIHDRNRINASRNNLVRVFFRSLSKYYQSRFLSGASKHADISHRNMTLVDDQTLEENLALLNVRKHLESDLNTSLWALGQRIALLSGGKKMPLKDLPMAPEHYCLALQEALGTVELSKKGRLLIYKMFDRSFMPGLNALYDTANNEFERHGVLPNLRFKVEKSKGNRYTGASPRDHSPGATGLASGQESQLKLLQRVYELQTRLIDDESVKAINYSATQLMEAAENLQKLSRQRSEKLMGEAAAIPVQDIRLGSGDFKIQLQQVLGNVDDVHLSKGDIATIDLVGMLFEYILNDEQLPDCVKAALSYLHTPYLKIAFADHDFFQQEDHPARLLLDSLADAGVRWVAHDGSSQYQVFEQIRQVVKSIVDEFEYDTRLFASQLIEFNSFVQKIELRVELMERRATEKARGEDRLREVKERVSAELRQRAKGRELPSAILLFLLQPWSDYMAFLLLRYGDRAESWHQALNLIEDMLWGLELGDEESDKIRWRQHYPWIEATMEKGFELIGYSRSKARKLKRAIDKVYAASLKNKPLDDSVDATRAKLIKLAERRLSEPESPQIQSDQVQAMIERLRLMEFGTWFEYKDGRREKVAWFNASSLHFLFVDQSGKRTGIRTGHEIAQDVIAGEMRMIIGSAKPLVERTLESIYQDLNLRAEAQGA